VWKSAGEPRRVPGTNSSLKAQEAKTPNGQFSRGVSDISKEHSFFRVVARGTIPWLRSTTHTKVPS
jgi:hypothetical protein